MEDLAAFTNDLHGYLMSDGAVKPRISGVGTTPKGTATARTTAAPAQAGSDPLRRPQTTPTGAQ
jgi:biopolymer transport protein ExbB